MTNNTERFVPISDLPPLDQADESTALTWDFALPPSIDTGRLVFDVAALNRIHKIGAFLSTRILSYDGEQTHMEPTIAGINPDGSAIRGMISKVNRAEPSKRHLIDEFDRNGAQDYGKTTVLHELNKPEIVSRVADRVISHRGREYTREEAWASVLSDALAESTRRAAYGHLVGRPNPVLKALIASNYLYSGTYIGLDIADGYPYESVAFAAYLLTTIGTLIVGADSVINKVKYGKHHLEDRRWSLNAFGNMQPDRYLAVNALTRVAPLVRAQA